MRPSSSYRAARRNNRSHLAKVKNLVGEALIKELRGKWNCYPEIPIVREARKVEHGFQGFGGRNR